MKYLTLIRHAKAGPADSGSGDKERSLSERGCSDARTMGKVLGEYSRAPQAVLVSTARRAVQTAELLKPPVDPELHQQLYLADEEILWDFAYSAFLQHDVVWIVAHNPGVSEAVERLSGSRVENVPPGGVLTIAFDELDPGGGNGRLVFYDIPAHHR